MVYWNFEQASLFGEAYSTYDAGYLSQARNAAARKEALVPLDRSSSDNRAETILI